MTNRIGIVRKGREKTWVVLLPQGRLNVECPSCIIYYPGYVQKKGK